jgi:hypothetical protein
MASSSVDGAEDKAEESESAMMNTRQRWQLRRGGGGKVCLSEGRNEEETSVGFSSWTDQRSELNYIELGMPQWPASRHPGIVHAPSLQLAQMQPHTPPLDIDGPAKS